MPSSAPRSSLYVSVTTGSLPSSLVPAAYSTGRRLFALSMKFASVWLVFLVAGSPQVLTCWPSAPAVTRTAVLVLPPAAIVTLSTLVMSKPFGSWSCRFEMPTSIEDTMSRDSTYALPVACSIA